MDGSRVCGTSCIVADGNGSHRHLKAMHKWSERMPAVGVEHIAMHREADIGLDCWHAVID